MQAAYLFVALLGTLTSPGIAQAVTPTPSPPPATAWHNPPNSGWSIFDPCGGPKELLNKFGPTPCVYILGEGMVSAGYSNISTHGALAVSRGPREVSFPFSGNANVYPSLLLAFGVSPSSQLQITAPSQVDINTARFGTVSAASNPSFNYKQRLYFSQTAYTQLAIDLGYTGPTNGGGINSPGPSYQIQLDLAQPLNANLSIGPWWTFKNAQSAGLTRTKERSWSDPLGVYFVWSPAYSSFELLPVVYHDFNPNRTALAIEAVQLLSRHVSVAVTYGGAESSTQSNGPFAQAFTFGTSSSPRVFGVNLYCLVNESNLPPQPPPPASPTPSPTP